MSTDPNAGQPTRTATRVSFDTLSDAPANPLVPARPETPMTATVSDVRTTAAPTRMLTEEEINKLGAGASQGLDSISNRLLSVQRAGDTGELGQKLNQLIVEAKGLDPASMKSKGVVGKVLGFFSNAKENFLGNYDTVMGRIDTLVKQIDQEMNIQRQRMRDLDDMANGLRDYHTKLEDAVAQGQGAVAAFDVEIARREGENSTDAFAVSDLADLRDRRNSLDKRVDDFQRNMLLIKQTAPAILMMKQNARDLITTFEDIKVTTIPVWRNVFSQYLISLDQKRAAQLTTSVRDATNDAIRRQAEQLGQNATAIATARQRSSIDLETLQLNQQKLLETLDNVAAIEKKGREDRAAAKPQLEMLEKELVNRFAKPQR